MKKTQCFYIKEETDAILEARAEETGQAKGRIIDHLVKENFDFVNELKRTSDKLHEKYLAYMRFGLD